MTGKWSGHGEIDRLGGGGSKMSEDKRLVDVIVEVLHELDATESHPQHRSRFNLIIETRWKKLGHVIASNSDFGQEISAELHRHSSDASKGKQVKGTERDLFRMHGSGYWSLRDGTPLQLKCGRRTAPPCNLDALAEAAVLFLVDEGKLDGNDTAAIGTKRDAFRRLFENPKSIPKVYGIPGVEAHYNKLTSKAADLQDSARAMPASCSGSMGEDEREWLEYEKARAAHERNPSLHPMPLRPWQRGAHIDSLPIEHNESMEGKRWPAQDPLCPSAR
jgi:hypothetical protein